MSSMLRRVGIAFGSLVAAWLIVAVAFGPLVGALGGVVAIILGALIYRDIMRRELPPSPGR
jgi:hypothetical protein